MGDSIALVVLLSLASDDNAVFVLFVDLQILD